MKSLDTYDFTICIYVDSDNPTLELKREETTLSSAINFCRKLHQKNTEIELNIYSSENSTEPYLLFKKDLSQEELTFEGQLMIREEFNLKNI